MNYIIVTGIVQAIVALLFLTGNKLRRTGADNLLMLLLICLSTHLAIKLVIFNLVQDALVRERMNTFIGFCYGPVLLLYARKVRDESFVPLKNLYLFIPFFLAFAGYLTVVATLSISLEIGHSVLALYNNVTGLALCSFNLIFSLLAFRISRKLKGSRKKEALLIRRIAFCLALVSFSGLLAAPFGGFLNPNGNLVVRSFCYLVLSCIGILILRYKYDLPPAETTEHKVLPEPERDISFDLLSEDYIEAASVLPSIEDGQRRTQLVHSEHQKILDQLEVYLRKSSAYADPELSLEKLAKAIGVSRHNLSETLNHFAGKTFYQYINEWRIGQVKEQINDLARKEIPINFLILAYDNGFKAKSSFNAYFKKITGCTPTAYLKGLNEPAMI